MIAATTAVIKHCMIKQEFDSLLAREDNTRACATVTVLPTIIYASLCSSHLIISESLLVIYMIKSRKLFINVQQEVLKLK